MAGASYEKGTIKFFPATVDTGKGWGIQPAPDRYGVTVEGRGDLDEVYWNFDPSPHVGKEAWVIISWKITGDKLA